MGTRARKRAGGQTEGKGGEGGVLVGNKSFVNIDRILMTEPIYRKVAGGQLQLH